MTDEPRFPPPGGPIAGYRDAGTPVPEEVVHPPVPDGPELPRGKRVVATRPDDPEVAIAKATYPAGKPLENKASVAGTIVFVVFVVGYIVLNCAHCSPAAPQETVVIQPLPPPAQSAQSAQPVTVRTHLHPLEHRVARGADRDGDGIADDVDKCPDDPEDFDGFQDEDGCPDPDNDGDGILDVNDKCPNIPETFNGFEDDDGCPDVAPPKKHP